MDGAEYLVVGLLVGSVVGPLCAVAFNMSWPYRFVGFCRRLLGARESPTNPTVVVLKARRILSRKNRTPVGAISKSA